MGGLTTASGISGSLSAADLVSAVLQKGIYLSNLQSILSQVMVPNLTGTIPISAIGEIDEDLEEMESSKIQGAEFTSIKFDLKKDRVKLAVSDEAEYKSRAGDPLTLQIDGEAMKLAAALDKKVAKAIETLPQTGAATAKWDISSNNIFKDIGRAVRMVKPYKADYIAMPTNVHEYYMQNDYIAKLATGNPAVLEGAINKVPGYNLDIFVDDNLTAKSFTVGAAKYSAVLGKGPVKVRKWDEEDIGATVYQMDVFRQVKGPIYLNSDGLNMAAYKCTGIIS